jgi:hypothetical protein
MQQLICLILAYIAPAEVPHIAELATTSCCVAASADREISPVAIAITFAKKNALIYL